MTPRELDIYLDAFIEQANQNHERMIIYAYMGAYLQRVKKMPPLKNMLETKKKKKQTAKDMLEEIKKLNASFGGETY